jgi:hypothetical protein
MKKLILIYSLTSFTLGFAQEKKTPFTKELDYQFVSSKKNTIDKLLEMKMYAGNNAEFLSKVSISGFPVYFYTDELGTSMVSLEMGNRLIGYDLSPFLGYGGFYGYTDNYSENEKNNFEVEKLDIKENILGISCTQHLFQFGKKDRFKACVDEKSPYNNFSVLQGLSQQFIKKSMGNKVNLKGLILKIAPEDSYDSEYVILTSMKDSKDFVLFDHKKAMTDQQKKQDSIMLAYKKLEEEYKAESLYPEDSVAIDSAITAPSVANDDYDSDYYYGPNYISKYKDPPNESGGLAIDNMYDQKLWKILPNHCQNFEKDFPEFSNSELKNHLKNYVGQMCDMYLTQSSSNYVAIKITLDEIRREVLFLNNVQGKLNKSDKKKLSDYLNSLD